MLHYLRGVQTAGTLDGPKVVAAMKATPINDFWSKNVRVREDGQAMRPMHLMQVKSPAESQSKYDIFKLMGDISPEKFLEASVRECVPLHPKRLEFARFRRWR